MVNYYPYYEPSQPAAIVACVLFSIGFVLSLYQTIVTKAWIWFVMVLSVASPYLSLSNDIPGVNN